MVEAKDLPPELLRRRARCDAPSRPPAPAVVEGAAHAAAPVVAPVSPPRPAATSVPRRRRPRSRRRCRRHWLAASSARRASCCEAGDAEVWDTLTRKFEAQLIHTALEITRGRRIEAAQKLGIGRNTITRKIQELGLDD